MAVTRSTIRERRGEPQRSRAVDASGRGVERLLLALTSILLAGALFLTAQARLARATDAQAATLNLASVDRREQLLPYLQGIASPVERQYVTAKIFLALPGGNGGISHVGEIGQIRVPVREVLSTRGLTDLQARARQLQARHPEAETISLLTSVELAGLKPSFTVRDGSRYRKQLILWAALFLGSFAAVHLFWSFRKTRGSQFLLPAVLLLSGIGMTLMVTLRDPLRDTLLFASFAEGAAVGCLALAFASRLNYRRLTGKLSYVFLLGSFALSAALILFGSGPTGSDAKVNLFGFQPAEIIRVLIVFFLAGYFAERWELLRTLRQQRAPSSKLPGWFEMPRLEYFLPVLAGVAVSLGFFFLQKDLGPALLIACLFLSMYAVARDRYVLALAGWVFILAGFV